MKIIKSEKLFNLLSWTWGLPMTLIGYGIAAVLKALGYTPKKWGYCYYFEVGENWGGVNFGPIFLTSKNPSEHTKAHEHGHGLQNCFFGFLTPFVILIPSASRYWYREYLVISGKKKYSELPDYDSAWFEGSATQLGTEFMDWYNNNTK